MNKSIEVEVQLKVSDEQKNKIMEFIGKNGAFKYKTWQIDTYYVPAHRDFLKYEYVYEWLRLREEAKQLSICYKHYFPENSPKNTHCEESETTVGDINAMKKLLKGLDFKEIIVVNKTREVWESNGYEFCFDTIKNLGEFVEIELIKDTKEPEKEKEKIFEFIQQWGIARTQANNRGYPYLLMEKMGLR